MNVFKGKTFPTKHFSSQILDFHRTPRNDFKLFILINCEVKRRKCWKRGTFSSIANKTRIIITQSSEIFLYFSFSKSDCLTTELSYTKVWWNDCKPTFHDNVWQTRWSRHICRDEESFSCEQLIPLPSNSDEHRSHHVSVRDEKRARLTLEKFFSLSSSVVCWNVLSSLCWHFLASTLEGWTNTWAQSKNRFCRWWRQHDFHVFQFFSLLDFPAKSSFSPLFL